jgi:hypothetical protein
MSQSRQLAVEHVPFEIVPRTENLQGDFIFGSSLAPPASERFGPIVGNWACKISAKYSLRVSYVEGRFGGDIASSGRMAASAGTPWSGRWAAVLGRVEGSTITFASIFTRS